ncbi:hypothetical protein BJ875DRAFT_437138 [Amylocarpus encephaloides]|uniref:Uncharacterized protein n=1 Tax=Amylocarpus encephaloides TaxID=45428 RepID=A0A9P7YSB1_9HELO|nr:hypothetical protein BJ875DRAFT_437138 [Amylocarpus encephaloides]
MSVASSAARSHTIMEEALLMHFWPLTKKILGKGKGGLTWMEVARRMKAKNEAEGLGISRRYTGDSIAQYVSRNWRRLIVDWGNYGQVADRQIASHTATPASAISSGTPTSTPDREIAPDAATQASAGPLVSPTPSPDREISSCTATQASVVPSVTPTPSTDKDIASNTATQASAIPSASATPPPDDQASVDVPAADQEAKDSGSTATANSSPSDEAVSTSHQQIRDEITALPGFTSLTALEILAEVSSRASYM